MSRTYFSFKRDSSRTSKSRRKSKRFAKKSYKKEEITDGNMFKKFFETWDIADFSYFKCPNKFCSFKRKKEKIDIKKIKPKYRKRIVNEQKKWIDFKDE